MQWYKFLQSNGFLLRHSMDPLLAVKREVSIRGAREVPAFQRTGQILHAWPGTSQRRAGSQDHRREMETGEKAGMVTVCGVLFLPIQPLLTM